MIIKSDNDLTRAIQNGKVKEIHVFKDTYSIEFTKDVTISDNYAKRLKEQKPKHDEENDDK